MRPPFQVIDSDGHINEPEEIIATYMPPPYDAYLHAWKANAGGDVYSNNTLVPKQPGMDPTMGGALGTNGPSGFPFPSDWLAIMDEAGVEKTYLYPTAFLPYSMMVDPEYTVAVTRAYNSFIHDHWLQVDDRFGAVAVMPLIDAEESAKELRRSVTELGFAGAFTPAVGYGLIGRKQNHPFFAEAQDLDTTVAIHGGHATAEYIPYTRFIQRHAVGFPVSQIIQMTSLALEGIFELFPTLRVAFLEAGCTWVPYMLDRLDEEWELRGKVEAPMCKRAAQRVPARQQRIRPPGTRRETAAPDHRHPRRRRPGLRLRLASLGQRLPQQHRPHLGERRHHGRSEAGHPQGQPSCHVRHQ